jgi:hypothetical protein
MLVKRSKSNHQMKLAHGHGSSLFVTRHKIESGHYKRDEEALSRIHGHIGKGVMDTFKAVAPDFSRFVVEFPHGDIYSRA